MSASTPKQYVIKRAGEKEQLDINKIHFVLEEAVEGIPDVSVSDIVMNASLQFFDGITTKAIHQTLIRSASDLISEKHPNYEIVTANLINYFLRKEVFDHYCTPPLLQVIQTNIQAKMYDPDILKRFTTEEINTLDSYIDHKRDGLFKAAGIQQVIDKYILRDRATDKLFETPQYMYMLIAMCTYINYDRFGTKVRMKYIRQYYDAISTHELNLPTPNMCAVRTNLKQYASCVKIDIADDLDGILTGDSAIKKYTSQGAGIGINTGRIRPLGSKIGNGSKTHTGIIPFLKCFEASVLCCTQNGVRGGSATTHVPFWHGEIDDIIVLKNNKGTPETRVRKLDYSVQVNRLFYERVKNNQTISLFSPKDVPDLYDNMGNIETFTKLYQKYEKDSSLVLSTVNARDLFGRMIKERIETGRIYFMNMDHVNSHSSFIDPIFMSNLCQEITLPTTPLKYLNDPDGEIALCILMAINAGKLTLKNLQSKMKHLCHLAVTALDELISLQEYPILAAELSTKRRRSLGIGFIGLAHFLAKNKIPYNSQEAIDTVDRITESLQYHLISASVDLAERDGPCEYWKKTKYGQGILPIDTYTKHVDTICSRPLELDWEALRAKLKQFGIRNSTLTAQMPSESSSVVSNETNGIEVPRDVVQFKRSGAGILKMLVPEYNKYKEYYTLAWSPEYDNIQYLKIASVMQKYFDQAISINEYYNPKFYENNEIPTKNVMQFLMTGYTLGMKNAYYLNVYDGKIEEASQAEKIKLEEQYSVSCTSDSCAI